LFIALDIHFCICLFAQITVSINPHFIAFINHCRFTTAKEQLKIKQFSTLMSSGRGWHSKWQGFA
jgi:hypothetical protein